LIKRFLIYLIIISGAIITLLPFIWMLTTALKTSGEVYLMPPRFLPADPQWQNFLIIQEQVPIIRYLFNSTIVALSVTIGTLITSILAAFAFTYIKFWGRDILFVIFLSTMMVPGEILMIPNFVTLAQLNWLNRYQALIVPWLIGVFAIFLLKQQFLSIPIELYESAKIDGCKDFMFLWKILVPLSKPALVSIALLKIIYNWNAFLWPLLVTNTPEMRTLPVGLASFMTEAGSNYELLMAYSTIIILPIIIVYIVAQKEIIKGVSSNQGIKG